MARAEAAHASAHSDSIKGLAQSIAKPAYRRLLTAEPALRRAVPALIVAFLVTIAVGAAIQILDHRRQAIADAINEIETIAEVLVNRIDRPRSGASANRIRAELGAALTPRTTANARRIFITDISGTVVAAAPDVDGIVGRSLGEFIGASAPPTVMVANAGVLEIALPDESHALAAIHNLDPPNGQVIIVQRHSDALAAWRSDTALTVTLSTTTGFVLLILGFAFHWQATRAREADLIYDTVRSRIDTALNRGRCGLWDWDLARGRIFWSHSMFAILGLPPRDDLLTFGEVSSYVHPDDIKLYDLAAEITESKAMLVDHAFRMRHANGKWIWLRARCELVRQPNDSGMHLIGIAVDITEQKTLVEKTVTADLRLRDAIETIPEAFVLWDADNRLVMCNSNFQELHNLPDEAITSGAPYEAVVNAGRKHLIRAKIPSEDRDVPGARTFEAQLDNGHWLHISERRTKDGGYVSVGTDITTLKLHEKKLMDSERRLIATIDDLRNSQQKLEIQTQQLADLAQKYAEEKTRAEEANQAKTKFLANMSHELRTPLNAIIGFSEIMESGMFGALGTDKYYEYCRDIRESGQYLLDVISDILDMSKIEAGRLRLNTEDVELDQIFADSIRVVSGRAANKNLTLISRVDENIRFKADRRALKQIALNLLSNAVKFTPEGGSITVRGRMATNCVIVGISDTGIGIAKDALQKLGRPFEQVESQHTKSHQGSGLGLAIAKSLVRLHGGTMRIRSKPGTGTIVMLRLPLAAGPATDDISAAVAA